MPELSLDIDSDVNKGVLSYQCLISHKQRYLCFHARVPKVRPFLHIEKLDQRTSSAFLYLK